MDAALCSQKNQGTERKRNPVPGMGRVLGKEEVVLGKGSKMIPLVLDWRELSKVLGVDSQGKEVKGSEVGAISAHPMLWPLLSPGYPQEGEYSQHFPFPEADHLPLPPFYSLSALSPPVLHITSAIVLPFPLPSCSGH